MRYLLLLSIFLVSCATSSHHYQPPGDTPDAPSVSNLSHRAGLGDWTRFTLIYIDNVQVSYRRPWYDPFRDMDTTNITAGRHKLLIKSEFEKKGSDCPCVAMAELSFDAKEGVAYQLRGEILDSTEAQEGTESPVNTVEFWIEEQNSGRPVTEKTSADAIRVKYSSPITIVY